MDTKPLSPLVNPNSFRFQFLATLFILWIFTKVFCSIGFVTTAVGTLIVLLALSWKITKLIQKHYFNETLGSVNKAVLVTGMTN